MDQLSVSEPVGTLGKLFGTQFALERLFTSMNSCMQYNASLGTKSFRTMITFKRSLIKINFSMNINTTLPDWTVLAKLGVMWFVFVYFFMLLKGLNTHKTFRAKVAFQWIFLFIMPFVWFLKSPNRTNVLKQETHSLSFLSSSECINTTCVLRFYDDTKQFPQKLKRVLVWLNILPLLTANFMKINIR